MKFARQTKNPALSCRAFLPAQEPVKDLDAGGLLAFWALNYFKGDLLAFLERLETAHVD